MGEMVALLPVVLMARFNLTFLTKSYMFSKSQVRISDSLVNTVGLPSCSFKA